MRTIALALAALIGLPALARAQASVDVHFNLPVVLPRLVVVSPGVQVVPEVEEEVFFTDGYYWARRDSGWYRSRSHRGGWVLIPGRRVPARLAQVPAGKYKYWKAEKAAAKAERREERREERGDDRGHGKHKGHGWH
ncbi:MAG TPA: hypothetical protein VF912_16425 [Anaeromyxobacter sp.]